MSLNINSYFSSIGNASNGINKNSGQYKAVVKNSLSGIIANEAMMSDEERLVYEMFGGRDAIIKNKMKMYDSNGSERRWRSRNGYDRKKSFRKAADYWCFREVLPKDV